MNEDAGKQGWLGPAPVLPTYDLAQDVQHGPGEGMKARMVQRGRPGRERELSQAKGCHPEPWLMT